MTEQFADENPFLVLQISPTLDLAVVKRAYYTQLAKHPPHKDPEGFRRLRAAHDRLLQPHAMAAEYLACPLDIEGELRDYAARFDDAIAAVKSAQARERDSQIKMRRFDEVLSRTKLSELLARLGRG